jgi:hypothetical protein
VRRSGSTITTAAASFANAAAACAPLWLSAVVVLCLCIPVAMIPITLSILRVDETAKFFAISGFCGEIYFVLQS